ncbi:hypothetical protein [Abyssisolibacter fermentans]|uniref:hypothetical protein n=1 Tax=Abyssisolibacter fermentans TaxID=1766203 RepID=UPI00082FE74F|nr:hypothetical protein [Abyssisolibacter fermentans]
MKIKNSVLIGAIVIILFGGIYFSDFMGWWQTESSKQPVKFKTGEFEGMPNPEDIRGSYSFKDIENAFGVEAKIIAKAFNIQTDQPSDMKAKDLEEIYSNLGQDIEIETGSVKLFVSLYTGLPYEGDDYISLQAVELLKEEGKWTEELQRSLADRIIDLPSATQENTVVSQEDEEEHEEEQVVKGKTTVKDAIEWGLTIEEIEEVVGGTIENVNLLIRDICIENGVSFSEAKTKLNDMLEKK